MYALAIDKKQTTYDTILKFIVDSDPGIKPSHIMLDFEKGAVNVASKYFPQAKIHCCFFHLGQCFWRHIQSLGLQEIYNENATFAWNLRHLLALAFVPETNVIAAYDTLVANDFFKINEENEWNTQLQS